MNRTADKHNFPNHFKYNGQDYKKNDDIANGFNDYFINVGPTLAASMPNSHLNSVTLPPVNLPNSFVLTPTSPFEITSIIDKLKPKTSKGIDEISPKLLKSNNVLIAEPLSFIANLSLQSGLFPTDMKIARVIPINKSKDKTSFQNYRSISLLPAFSEIFERLVYNRFYKYLTINNSRAIWLFEKIDQLNLPSRNYKIE